MCAVITDASYSVSFARACLTPVWSFVDPRIAAGSMPEIQNALKAAENVLAAIYLIPVPAARSGRKALQRKYHLHAGRHRHIASIHLAGQA